MSSTDTVRCVSCGTETHPDDIIVFGNDSVCSACKAIYVQCLKEGASLPISPPSHEVLRHKKHVVITAKSMPPQRCFTCNTTEGIRWQNVMTGVKNRREAVSSTHVPLTVGMCEKCLRGKKIARVTFFLSLIGIYGTYATISLVGTIGVIMLPLLVGGLIWSHYLSRYIKVQRIRGGRIFISGACRAYLASLPEL